MEWKNGNFICNVELYVSLFCFILLLGLICSIFLIDMQICLTNPECHKNLIKKNKHEIKIVQFFFGGEQDSTIAQYCDELWISSAFKFGNGKMCFLYSRNISVACLY